MKLLTKLLLMLFPGGGLLQLLIGAADGPDPDLSKPVDIFDQTPYKEQVWKREHPDEEYDESKVDKNGDSIPEEE